MHYLDVGERDAPPMLLLHGNPTWSFYWRKLIAHYSARFRVIAPDHIGCGLSDKPQGWPYRLEGHIHNIEALIDHLDLQDITLVVHDWGGAIGLGAATRRPARFKRLIITNTAAFLSQDIPASIASVKLPIFGALAVRGLNAFARVAALRATTKPLNLVARAGLLYPYRSWRSRVATLRFVEDIPLKPSHPSYATLKAIDEGLADLKQPMLICWGDDDFCFTPKFRAEWQRRFPEAEVHAWEGVGHYVCEDAPTRLIERMDAFLEINA
ncbi:alpha/beta fold hydrolase [Myxococcota bacterium]|nr:alpha/beta fold hydrolase [Myxococcota bacterium]MBU1433222.1 alpha/beta fold hydrolase [Myxococcota bacterium]MBU1900632.1 alpha/beta fold hydrolase [Myxococcota bacterium]